MILQYLTRLLFSFDYEKRLKYVGGLWGGLAMASITYFLLIKGAKGASFMDSDLKASIKDNAFLIILVSFVGWSTLLQLLIWLTKIDILKFIVLVGTFSLAMAFAGNDLVNFIGVPLAGFNSYEMFVASGSADASSFSMEGLAGKVPTPTLLLLVAGIIMTITLWTSKKARSVVRTSLDLGRQYEGSERFASSAVSRGLVRNVVKLASWINDKLPVDLNKSISKQFDQSPFIKKQAEYKEDPPAFDLVRAAVTLVTASILISIGTALKLPLSTTYVTFMVFMGTSLADGAWGRESAVFRVSGVLSVVGGWFFTAFSAFTAAFVIALLFHFGGLLAIGLMILVAAYVIYRSHRYHHQREEDQMEFEKSLELGALTRENVINKNVKHMTGIIGSFNTLIDQTLDALGNEDLETLNKVYKKFSALYNKTAKLKLKAGKALNKIQDDDIEVGHAYILTVEYLREMAHHVKNIIEPSRNHVANQHKPLLKDQIDDLKAIQQRLKSRLTDTIQVFKSLNADEGNRVLEGLPEFLKQIRQVRKTQIKRIKNHQIGTRNSLLFLNHLGEFRNIAIFANRLIKVYEDMVIIDDDTENTEQVENIS